MRISPHERFGGGRIYLQLLQESHLPDWQSFKLRNRTFFEPFQAMQSDEDFTEQKLRSALRKYAEEASADSAYTFGIFAAGTGELIGYIRFGAVQRGVFQNSYLGYALDERHNGQGFMTEAVRVGLGAAFGPLGLHRIQAAIMPHNASSLRVVEKNRFRREGYAKNYLNMNGRWEDHVLFALVAEDWLRPQSESADRFE